MIQFMVTIKLLKKIVFFSRICWILFRRMTIMIKLTKKEGVQQERLLFQVHYIIEDYDLWQIVFSRPLM